MLRIGRRRAPKRHHAIADEFVQRAVPPDDDVGHQSQIEIDGVQGLARLLVKTGLRRRAAQVVSAHKSRRLLLRGVRQLGESPDVREQDGHFAPGASQREGLGMKQLFHNLGGNNLREDGLHPPHFRLLKNHAPSNQADVVHEQCAAQRQHQRNPITRPPIQDHGTRDIGEARQEHQTGGQQHAQLPRQQRGDYPEHDDQGHFRPKRRSPDEAARQD